MSFEGEKEVQATDARTNEYIPPLEFTVRNPDDLAKLRALWAQRPGIPKLVQTRELGEDNSWPGFDIRTLLRGEESSGRFSFHSIIVAPGATLPAHYHDVGDTYWFVLDGEIEMTVGSVVQRMSRDTVAFVPERTTQSLTNRSASAATMFAGFSPAGADRAFAAAHRLWKQQPNSSADAYFAVLAAHGFRPTSGKPMPNDARTNETVARLEAEVRTFDDFLALRHRWAAGVPTPKLVLDRRACMNIPIGDQETRVLLNADEASGRSVVFYVGLDPGFGAAAHHQPMEEEIFLVTQGPLTLIIGNQRTTQAERGTFGFAPRFGTHAFNNDGKAGRMTMFTLNSPGGHDRGFEMILREMGSEKFGELLVAHGFQFHAAM